MCLFVMAGVMPRTKHLREDVAYCEPDYGKAYIAAKPNVKGLH